MTNRFKIGNTAYVRLTTEDEDLDSFTEQFGQDIVITDIEDDCFWGFNPEHLTFCPYHIEFRDVVDIEETNIDVEAIPYYTIKQVERCSDCGKFVAHN